MRVMAGWRAAIPASETPIPPANSSAPQASTTPAWDSRPLAVLTRTAPVRASKAHVAVVGHITAAELAAHMNALEAANGFLNRFCFVACRRHRLLPEGGASDPLAGSGLEERLGANIEAARRVGQVALDPSGRARWHEIYVTLSEPEDGIVGSLCARAEAHVLRLGMLYALVDGDSAISTHHLEAGFALWQYAQRSVAWALRTVTTDPVLRQIRAALESAPDGLTRTELRDLFNRNQPAVRVDTALALLANAGRAQRRRQHTAGRPVEIWAATNPTTV